MKIIRGLILPAMILLFIDSLTFAQEDSLNDYVLSPEDMEVEIVLDSIEQQESACDTFPAYDLYKNLWNSTNIRYSSASFINKNDTLLITLVSPDDLPYCHPYKGKVISKFGRRSGRMHTGTDVKLHPGDSVYCAFDGKVRLAKRFNGYGNLVLVRHNNGLETIYAHLKSIKVKVNENVKAGDLIGLGGRTGRATTDHLHFETRIFGDPFDSNKYIDFDNFCLRTNTIYYNNKKIYTDQDQIKIRVPDNQLTAKNDKNTGLSEKADTDNEDNLIQYIIKKGDNLWIIAKKYNTTIKSLCDLNEITPNQLLKIGSIIFIR